jgi:hypothetical protein
VTEPDAASTAADGFVVRWEASGAVERANYAMFLDRSSAFPREINGSSRLFRAMSQEVVNRV